MGETVYVHNRKDDDGDKEKLTYTSRSCMCNSHCNDDTLTYHDVLGDDYSITIEGGDMKYIMYELFECAVVYDKLKFWLEETGNTEVLDKLKQLKESGVKCLKQKK
jgi:hypothetical protein